MKGFRTFLLRGNVVDLAVGIVVGAAFTALVTAFVKAFLTPHVGIRGDVRHLHTLQDVDVPVFGSVATQVFISQKLDFWRASAGVAFRF